MHVNPLSLLSRREGRYHTATLGTDHAYVLVDKMSIRLKIGQQAMALSFPNQKHNVYISVSCEET